MLTTLSWSVAVSAIANWAAIETWHHGSLFEGFRARLEVRRDRFPADLLLCPYCLSHWTGALLLALVLAMTIDFSGWEWWHYPGLIALWLCVVRLSNLANDLTRKWCRTPGRTVPVTLEDQILSGIAGGSYDPTPIPFESGVQPLEPGKPYSG